MTAPAAVQARPVQARRAFRVMGWKKPADPVTVNFHARTTQGEREALDEVISRWAAKQAALGSSASGQTSIAWFRQLVRKLAADEGITVRDSSGDAGPGV